MKNLKNTGNTKARGTIYLYLLQQKTKTKPSISANRTNIFYSKCHFANLEASTRRWKAQSETTQDKIQVWDCISLKRIIAVMTTHCIQNPEMLTLHYGKSTVCTFRETEAVCKQLSSSLSGDCDCHLIKLLSGRKSQKHELWKERGIFWRMTCLP